MTTPIHEQNLHVHPLDSRIILDSEERVVADIREPLNEQGREVGFLFAASPDMARALLPLARFVEKLDLMPLRGTDDVLYGIHCGTPYEAEIRLSDLRKAVAALRKAKALP